MRTYYIWALLIACIAIPFIMIVLGAPRLIVLLVALVSGLTVGLVAAKIISLKGLATTFVDAAFLTWFALSFTHSIFEDLSNPRLATVDFYWTAFIVIFAAYSIVLALPVYYQYITRQPLIALLLVSAPILGSLLHHLFAMPIIIGLILGIPLGSLLLREVHHFTAEKVPDSKNIVYMLLFLLIAVSYAFRATNAIWYAVISALMAMLASGIFTREIVVRRMRRQMEREEAVE